MNYLDLTKNGGRFPRRSKGHSVMRQIVREIPFLCAGVVSEDWGYRHIPKCNYLFYAESAGDSGMEAIACVKTMGHLFYVDLICAKRGAGKHLLRYIESVALEKGLEGVLLCSLSKPFGFYAHVGYNVVADCVKGYHPDSYELLEEFEGKIRGKPSVFVRGCGSRRDECILMQKILKKARVETQRRVSLPRKAKSKV